MIFRIVIIKKEDLIIKPLQITDYEVGGFRTAFKGMRFPLDSNHKSDSKHLKDMFIIGGNDIDLAKRLVKSGSEHAKFLRQIHVNLEISAPLYWWKQFDQYKIGTTTNSSSTMHTLVKQPITKENFAPMPKKVENAEYIQEEYVKACEWLRTEYICTKNKDIWDTLVNTLPSSFIQKRMWSGSYANLINIISQRKNHKLIEWNLFIDYCLSELPYLEQFYSVLGDDIK